MKNILKVENNVTYTWIWNCFFVHLLKFPLILLMESHDQFWPILLQTVKFLQNIFYNKLVHVNYKWIKKYDKQIYLLKFHIFCQNFLKWQNYHSDRNCAYHPFLTLPWSVPSNLYFLGFFVFVFGFWFPHAYQSYGPFPACILHLSVGNRWQFRKSLSNVILAMPCMFLQ